MLVLSTPTLQSMSSHTVHDDAYSVVLERGGVCRSRATTAPSEQAMRGSRLSAALLAIACSCVTQPCAWRLVWAHRIICLSRRLRHLNVVLSRELPHVLDVDRPPSRQDATCCSLETQVLGTCSFPRESRYMRRLASAVGDIRRCDAMSLSSSMVSYLQERLVPC